MPIPNGFLKKSELNKHEKKFPLSVCLCKTCSLVQLTHTVPPKEMFNNYLYIPSTSADHMNHFRNFAEESIKKFKLTNEHLVVDIGSNDGSLLSFFKAKNIRTLGVDPAKNLAIGANLRGIKTINKYFTKEVAVDISKSHGRAQLVTATNVLAHIGDLHDFCRGLKLLMDENGIFIAEFPYVSNLIRKNLFDTIYHEHLSYFSIRPLVRLFKKHDLKIINIVKKPIDGGSIRIFVTRAKSRIKSSEAVKMVIKHELRLKLHLAITYEQFAKKVEAVKERLMKQLILIKSQKKKIVGYGAPAKGNILLNFCNIDGSILDYIVDSTPHKQGMFTPGTHIPIHPESKFERDMPDYTLLLTWNFAEEILKKQKRYRQKGGKFIINSPVFRIV